MPEKIQSEDKKFTVGIDRAVFFEIESDPVIRRGKNLSEMAARPGVIRALDYIIRHAIQLRASDIHLEPCSTSYQIRYRIDGGLRELPGVPLHVGQALGSRIKILCGMDISKRRVPLDGRFFLDGQEKEVEFRVSTLPTVFGEGVAIRILNRSTLHLNMDSLGMEKGTQAAFEECTHRDNGIILLTGPTGSGKTTTLYAAISELNQEKVKIVTAEEPVEYDINGVMQVDINHEIGLEFARTLRSMLRQDPDIILVGEIRDPETAKTATEAAMTGHLVLSTLHTRDAPTAITRLVDLGVEPYLISDTLVAVMAQRLVRRVCEYCKRPASSFHYPPDIDKVAFRPGNFQEGEGCIECTQSGYRGRVGLFELMVLGPELRDLVEKNSPAGEIRRVAKAGGMESLRFCGFRRIGEGLTTLKEVWAATPDSI